MSSNAQLKVPGYRVDKLLGKGGMATVYLATQMSLGRSVALKVLNDPETPQFFERFFNEGRCVARLRHDNLVTIYDIGQGEGFYYIAMEHLPGGDLKSRMAQGMKSSQSLKIIARLASCLGYVHSQGLVHRDIKPSNVLFRGDGTPVLTDFGIAKLIQADNDLTLTGTVLGSPHYLSPEQAEGNSKVDGRSDLYSLGVILFEMLAGRKPFSADSFAATLLAHIQNPIPPLPSQFAQFQPLTDRLLAKKPEDRFQSGTELLKNIRLLRGAGNHPVTPRKDKQTGDRRQSTSQAASGGPAMEKKPASRYLQRVGIGASLIGVLLLSSLLLDQNDPDTRAEATLSRAEPRTEHRIQQPTPEPTPTPVFAPVPKSVEEPTPTPVLAAEPQHEPELAPSTFIPTAVDAGADANQQEADAEIARWLEKAEQRIRQDRLSFPAGESARDYIRKVLVRDPVNHSARAMLEQIADRYAELARKRLNSGQYGKAQRLISHGLDARPRRADLKRLQRLAARKQAAARSTREKTADTQTPKPTSGKTQVPQRAADSWIFNQEHGS